MKKLAITQTLIKYLKNDDYCPAQVKELFIDKTIRSEPSASQLKGLYFEQQFLGKSAKDNTKVDLPRLKNGNKSVEHERIDSQVGVFRNLILERPIVIEQIQVKLSVPYNDNYDLEGEIDFVGFIDNKEEISLFDIKLTKSLYSEFYQGGYGPWSWEFPQNMDFTQAYMYNYLFEEQFKVNAPFYYLVFDYKPESEYKIIHKRIERHHRMELMESIRKTIEKIEYHKSVGWKYNPDYKNCSNCPLKDKCPEKNLKKPIKEII